MKILGVWVNSKLMEFLWNSPEFNTDFAKRGSDVLQARNKAIEYAESYHSTRSLILDLRDAVATHTRSQDLGPT